MSIFGRLRLDEITSSVPELGPTVTTGGHLWIKFIGITIIQITIPSVLSMYGVALGCIALMDHKQDINLLNEKIVLTPILLSAFWILSDPWTVRIVKLASAPRLVSLIGILLLSIGLLASGYLVTGGVGAHLARVSAGIVMGIGTSLTMAQCEKLLTDDFRTKLPLVNTLKKCAIAVGFILSPICSFSLFKENSLQIALLMSAIIFIPSVAATLTLKSSLPRTSSLYLLLSSEEESEFKHKDDSYNNFYSRRNVENKPSVTKGLEDNTIFTYDDGDEDDDLFIKPMRPIIQRGPWQNELAFFCTFKSWIGLLILIGTKSSQLFLWVFLPALAIVKKHPAASLYNGVALLVFTAIGCLVAIIVCHCNYHSKTYRNLSFGVATFFNGLCFLMFSSVDNFVLMLILTLLNGFCVGCIFATQENAIQCLWNSKQIGIRTQIIVSMLVSSAIMSYIALSNALLLLQIVSGLQITSGVLFLITILFS